MRSIRHRRLAFTLIEFMLTVAAAMGISAVVYRQYSIAEASARTQKETDLASDVSEGVLRTYTGESNFAGLSTSRAIADGLVPEQMVSADGSTINNAWGGTITLSGVDVSGDTDRGFQLVYTKVPGDACAKFVRRVAEDGQFDTVTVNTTSVMANRVLNIPALTAACNNSSTIDLRYTRGTPGQGGDQIEECVAPTAPEVRNTACGAGYTGSIVESRTGSCGGPYESVTWTPWTTDQNTCVIICVVDPASPQTRTSTPCASGYTGTITERRTSSCPQATGYPVWSGWTVTSNTCAANCVAPPAETRTSTPCASGFSGTITESRTAYCPAATGAYAWNAWTQTSSTCAANCVVPTPSTQTESQSIACAAPATTGTLNQQRTRTAYCPATTGAYAWGTYGSWATVSNNCCTPATTTRWISASGACPAGQGGGSVVWEKEQRQNYTCPTAAWGAWADTGATRNTVNTCQPTCVAPATTTETENNFATCGAGRVTVSGGSKNFTQTRTRPTTYSCAQTYGAYSSSVGAWSPWSPSEASACAAQCVAPANTSESQTVAGGTQAVGCPYGQVGQINQTRTANQTRTVTYSCPAPTGAYSTTYGAWTTQSYNAWTETSRTCAPPACDGTLEGNARNYEARYGDIYNAFGTNYTAAYNHWWQAGYSEGRQSCWGPPCNAPASTTATRVVPNATTTSAGCGAYRTGAIYYNASANQQQVTTYSCTSPTGSVVATPQGWTHVSYNGWVETSRTCAYPGCGDGSLMAHAKDYMSRGGDDLYNAFAGNWQAAYNHWSGAGYYEGRPQACWGPPCNVPASQTRWVGTSDTACPAGTAGTRYYEVEQRADGYCTSQTGSAGYGGWYGTGGWRNLNTSQCIATCTPQGAGYEYQDKYCTTGTTCETGEQRRWVTYSCASGSSQAATWGAWETLTHPICGSVKMGCP